MTEEEKIRAVFFRFEEGGLVDNDINKILSCMAEPLLGIGMGEQGIVRCQEDVRRVRDQGWKEGGTATHSLRYSKIETLLHTECFATLCAQVTVLSEEDGGQHISESSFLQLLTLLKQEGEWKICALHASAPVVTEEIVAAYPLKFAEKTLQSLREKIGEKAYQSEEQFRQAVLADTVAFYVINFTKNMIEKCQLNGDYCAYAKLGCAYDSFLSEGSPEYLIREDIARFVNQFSRENVLRAFERGEQELSLEYRIKLREGGYIWAVTVCRMIQDAETGDRKGIMYVRNIDRTKREEIALNLRASRDGMTGLYNKEALTGLIRQHLECPPAPCVGSFIVLDVDDFKSVNDVYGHPVGDIVLVELADILKAGIRRADLAGRLGGDEFALFLTGSEDKTQLQEMLSRILTRVEGIHLPDFPDLKVSCSMGAACCHRGDTFEDLYRKADSALYTAKKSGKNRICLYCD